MSNSIPAFVWRDFMLLRRNSASLVSMFVVPPLFLICLWAVFGYAAEGIDFDYLRFVLAGCIFQAAMFTAAASSMAVGVDIETGIVNRLRIIPGTTLAYVIGRMSIDFVRMTGSTITLFAVALVLGLRMPISEFGWTFLWAVIAAVVLCAITDSFMLVVDRPTAAAQAIQSFEMLFLMFSTAFIPAVAVSGWLHNVLVHMPFSPIIELIRAANPQTLSTSAIIEVAAWLVGLSVVAAAIHLSRFSSRRAF